MSEVPTDTSEVEDILKAPVGSLRGKKQMQGMAGQSEPVLNRRCRSKDIGPTCLSLSNMLAISPIYLWAPHMGTVPVQGRYKHAVSIFGRHQ